MNIDKIKEFLEWSEYLPYLDVYKGCWLIDEGDHTVTWELCADLDFNYSGEVTAAPLRKDGLVLVNINNCCGETITMVFLESEEIK